jgi:hypothetical protein
MTVTNSYSRLSNSSQSHILPAVSQLVNPGVKPHLEPKTKFLLLSGICAFVNVRHPLWREDGSVIYHGLSQQYMLLSELSLYKLGSNPTENTVSNSESIGVCVFVATKTCLPRGYHAKRFLLIPLFCLLGVMSWYPLSEMLHFFRILSPGIQKY